MVSDQLYKYRPGRRMDIKLRNLGDNDDPVSRLVALGGEVGKVPCDGCVRCCINDVIRILPQDDPSAYKTIPHPAMPGHLALAHKRDHRGRVCFYLGESGCTIHDRSPAMCQRVDCRVSALSVSAASTKKFRPGMRAMLKRGRELLAKLEGRQ